MITPLSQRVLGKTGLRVSAIGLGTAEIGLIYGVGKTSVPNDREASLLLETALDLGLTYVDTGRGYGLAEDRIGKLGIAQRKGVVIGTKCAQFLETGEDPRGHELARRIRDDVEASLKVLRADVLQLVQVHYGTKEQIERGELIDIMQQLKDEQKILHVGISTRGEPAGIAAVNSGFFETVQIAYSILDQRMLPNVLPMAKSNNVGVINRSVFLKGTLTPALEKLPPQLSSLRENATRARAIAEDLGITLPELAVRFALFQPLVSTVLIGTANPVNLRNAVETLEKGPLPDDVLEKLRFLAIEDANQVDPARWPKL